MALQMANNGKMTGKQKKTSIIFISVEDTGRGIKPELINKLFTK